MAEENYLQPRMALARRSQPFLDVVDHALPAVAFGEEAKILRRAGGAAVTAMVVRLDRNAVCGEEGGEIIVARGMLGHAVGDEEQSARRPVWLPAISGKFDAVAGAKGLANEAHPEL